MKLLHVCLCLFSCHAAIAGTVTVTQTVTGTATSTSTETSVWKRVDKSLNEGVRTAKKKFMDADDGSTKDAPAKKEKRHAPEKPAKEETGEKKGELDKVADSLNETWDSVLHGAGKILKTQQTSTSTTVSTATETGVR